MASPPQSFSPQMQQLIEALTDNVAQPKCASDDPSFGPRTGIPATDFQAAMHATYEHVKRLYEMPTETFMAYMQSQLDEAGITGLVGLIDRNGTIFAYVEPAGEHAQLMRIMKPSNEPKPWIAEPFDFSNYQSLQMNSMYVITERSDLYYVLLDRHTKIALSPRDGFFQDY